jgi:hypothetical protein
LPVAFNAEVRDSFKLTLFLGGLRAFIEQTAPGLVSWTSLQHDGQPYVKITANGLPFVGKLAVHYAATPDMLVVTLNEELLKRVLDRRRAAKTTDPAKAAAAAQAGTDKKGDAGNEAKARAEPASDPPRAWLGKSMALQVDGKAIELLERIFGRREFQALMQARAWSNIAILNEWKRLDPSRDPVAIHQEFWQTSLVCPAGGKYVWNNEFHTMESTVYGHPGEPKTGPTLPQPLKNVRWLDFGVTFENRGLRAKAEIRRTGGKSP